MGSMKRIARSVPAVLFASVFILFGVFSIWGQDIRDASLKHIRSARIIEMVIDGEKLFCLPEGCIKNGTAYELYREDGFFGTSIRVKAVPVSEIPEEDFSALYNDQTEDGLVVITLGITNYKSRNSYAIIPDEGLMDGEAVIIEK